MADGPRLSIEIAANLQQAIANFARAEQVVTTSTRAMDTAVTRTERTFTVLNRANFTFGANYARSATQATQASAVLARQSMSTSAAAGGAAASLVNAGAAVGRSSQNYTGLSRILQDLPFGFIGIQNNLTQLLPAAGLAGVAISAIVSALTFASIGTDNWTRGLKGNKSAIEAVALEGDEYAKTLDDVTAAQLKGTQNSISELTTLKLLYSEYTNANAPLKDRKDAYRQIQDEYPAYFKNIAFEKTASELTTAAYNNLTSAILATARARAAEDAIVKNTSRQLEDEQKIADLQVEIDKQVSKRQKQQAKNSEDLRKSGLYGSESEVSRQANLIQGFNEKIFESQKKINNLTTDKNKLEENNLRLIKSVNTEVSKGALLTGKVGSLPSNSGKKSGRSTDIVPAELITKFAGVTQTFSNELKDLSDDVQEVPVILTTTYSALDLFSDDVKELIESKYAPLFSSIGESIGNALASGTSVFEAAGNAVLGAFGGFLSEYGKLLIEYGAAAVLKGKLDVAALIPGAGIPAGIAAIAAGIALVAAGAAISSFASGKSSGSSSRKGTRVIPAFASGTDYAPGGTALVGEDGPELVNLPQGAQVIPNHNLGGIRGNTSISLTGNLGISMRTLYFALQDEAKLQNRRG